MKKDVVIHNQKRARKARNYSSCVISIDLWLFPFCKLIVVEEMKTIAAAETAGDFWIFLQSLPTIHSSHQYLEQMH